MAAVWGMMKGARSLAPEGWLAVYHGYPPGMAASSSALASAAGVYWVGTGGGTQIDKVLRVKPAPSHTQANTHTSPAVPALKPSYSQVTRLGIRAHDPGKQHVTGARD